MSGGLSEVGQLNQISLGLGQAATPPPPQPPPLTPRSIDWTLKPVWTVGETVEATGITVSDGPANAQQTAPAKVPQTKGGVDVEVVVVAPAQQGFAEATRSQMVTVERRKTTIRWKTPLPVLRGTVLGSAQLDAVVAPAGRGGGTFAPKAGTAMNTLGEQPLTVTYPEDDAHSFADATVTLMVVADKKGLAAETGKSAMLSGRAHKFRTAATDPKGAEVEAAFKAWNESDPADPTSMQAQGRKIMADVQAMTPKQLIKYMDGLITDPATQFWSNDTTPKGNPKPYPNKIWILPNGLQVRFKPNGDGKNGLTEPMFCIEGRRTDITGFSKEPQESAFKLMPNGEPGPIGPSDTALPALGLDTDGSDLTARAMDAACGQTHLFCPKPKPQVVTWAGPVTLAVGTALDAAAVGATALGGAEITFWNGATALAADAVLPGGAYKLTARAAETDAYLAGASGLVDVTVSRKPQVLTYKGPTELAVNAKLDRTLVEVLGEAPISFAVNGKVLGPSSRLPAGTVELEVRAAETDLHAAASVTATVTVTKSKWQITWDNPPPIRVGEKLTAAHLNAEAIGENGGQAPIIEYTDEEGDGIKPGGTLRMLDRYDDEDSSEGQDQTLTATVKTSALLNAASVDVTIRVLPAAREAPKAQKPTAKKTPPQKTPPKKGKGKK